MPKNEGNNEIDEKRLEEILDKEIVSVQSKNESPFEISIDKFGMTIATRPFEDFDPVTSNPIQSQDADKVLSKTESPMQDLMSIDQFGFTISIPVSSETTGKGKKIRQIICKCLC